MRKQIFIVIGMLVTVGGAAGAWAAESKLEAPSARDDTAPEQRITVRAKPRMVEEQGGTWLVVPMPEGEPARIYYHADPLPEQELEFAVWRSRRVYGVSEEGEEYAVTDFTLDSIKRGDVVLFDAGPCPIHRERMTRKAVEIHYGLLAIDPEGWKSFSGGPGWVGGGCAIMEGAPSRQWGYVCARCVQAYEKWSEEQRKRWEEHRAQEAAGKTP